MKEKGDHHMKGNGWLGGENQNYGSRQRETRWLTPRKYVDSIGEFDLDPCGAPGHDLARKTYLLENGDDGLRDPWFGHVWLNPPYGRQAPPFIERLADHGDGVALIFARTDTAMWHETIWPRASGILFLKGRVTFLSADREAPKSNSGAPSALVAYGEWAARALLNCDLPGYYVRLQGGLT